MRILIQRCSKQLRNRTEWICRTFAQFETNIRTAKKYHIYVKIAGTNLFSWNVYYLYKCLREKALVVTQSREKYLTCEISVRNATQIFKRSFNCFKQFLFNKIYTYMQKMIHYEINRIDPNEILYKKPTTYIRTYKKNYALC